MYMYVCNYVNRIYEFFVLVYGSKSFIYVCLYMRVGLCMCIMHVYMHIHMHMLFTYIYTYIYTCTYMCMHICVYMCVYIYTCTCI